MEHEKFSYVEALKWLANRYNVEIEETELSPEVKIQQQTADSLYILNAFAQKFFSDVLHNAEEGQNIGLSYLQERGFDAAVIEKFQLGYILQLLMLLLRMQSQLSTIPNFYRKAGLVVIRDGRAFDNYRGRINFSHS